MKCALVGFTVFEMLAQGDSKSRPKASINVRRRPRIAPSPMEWTRNSCGRGRNRSTPPSFATDRP